ncbi:MAG: NFACT RNA binding domain-containing protein [Candidatus Nanoarchaeia archaeon]
MTKVSISLDKSIHENASIYFEKAKKAKRKIDGAKLALEKTKKKLKQLEKERPENVEEQVLKKKRKKEWFEKFRWFVTSEGFLVIGGRDATTNELVIKKHTDRNDLVFHTDMAGSPFFVLKCDGKEIGEQTKQEVADATASFSRAWKAGLASTETFYVMPEQVTKEAQSGEFLPKGAFMVRGKNTYIKPKMNLAVCVYDDKIMCGPVEAVRTHANLYIVLEQGEKKPSDLAKEIKKHVKADNDEIIRALPTGGARIKEIKNAQG